MRRPSPRISQYSHPAQLLWGNRSPVRQSAVNGSLVAGLDIGYRVRAIMRAARIAAVIRRCPCHQLTGAERGAAPAELAEVADARVDRLAEETELVLLARAGCQ
jgi:hypothetical protein